MNNSLQEVQSIMSKNIEDMLQRGENLDQVGEKSSAYVTSYFVFVTYFLLLVPLISLVWNPFFCNRPSLRDASSHYKDLSKQLHMQALMKKYMPFAVLGLFILLIIYIKLM